MLLPDQCSGVVPDGSWGTKQFQGSNLGLQHEKAALNPLNYLFGP